LSFRFISQSFSRVLLGGFFTEKIFLKKGLDILTVYVLYSHQARGEAVSYTTRKGVKQMPITLTIHILGYTVTIRVKKQNRHSAK